MSRRGARLHVSEFALHAYGVHRHGVLRSTLSWRGLPARPRGAVAPSSRQDGGPPESGRHVGGACWAPGDSCQGLPASARQPACSLCAPLPWEPASASRQSGWRGAFPFYAIWGLFLHSFPGLPASPPPRAQPSGHGPLCGMQRRLLPAMASLALRSPAPPPSARVDSELHSVPSF